MKAPSTGPSTGPVGFCWSSGLPICPLIVPNGLCPFAPPIPPAPIPPPGAPGCAGGCCPCGFCPVGSGVCPAAGGGAFGSVGIVEGFCAPPDDPEVSVEFELLEFAPPTALPNPLEFVRLDAGTPSPG